MIHREMMIDQSKSFSSNLSHPGPICLIWPNGSKEYYVDRKRHREDGPAVEFVNGYRGFFLKGINYEKEEYWQKIYNLGLIDNKELLVRLI